VDHRQSGTAVAQPEREIDDVAAGGNRTPVTTQVQHLGVSPEADELRCVVLAGWDQYRAQAGQQGSLGNPRRLVGGADRAERRTANTSVPPAVARGEIVAQSAITCRRPASGPADSQPGPVTESSRAC